MRVYTVYFEDSSVKHIAIVRESFAWAYADAVKYANKHKTKVCSIVGGNEITEVSNVDM